MYAESVGLRSSATCCLTARISCSSPPRRMVHQVGNCAQRLLSVAEKTQRGALGQRSPDGAGSSKESPKARAPADDRLEAVSSSLQRSVDALERCLGAADPARDRG